MYNAAVDGITVKTCSVCGGTGWVHVFREGLDGVVRCDCVKASRVDRLFKNARIPQRYAHCELDNFELRPPHTTQKLQLAKIAAEKFVAEYPTSQPFGLLFMGPQGIGKTHLAVGIIKTLMRNKSVECLFRTFPELLKEIQNSYNPISQTSEVSLLSPVLETEVLVLDELGAQNPSTWVRDTVAYILNYRYNENKVTILTTNYQDEYEGREEKKEPKPDTLSQRIDERIRSRLFEMCKTIPMDGNDFRKEIKQVHYL